MTDSDEQPDVQYTPFPPFDAWRSADLDTTELDERCSWMTSDAVTADGMKRALKAISQLAAIETGAIEGLYDTNRGITYSIAAGASTIESAFSDQKTTSLIHDQLAAYDSVLDFATGSSPIAGKWVRELHAKLCASQETYRVLTTEGWRDRPLQHGTYKAEPNHVTLKSGAKHFYAPVADTEPEMARLLNELNRPDFQEADRVIQAAFAHYSLTCIHPFSDGNGRVARALASVFTFRNDSVPLLILADWRDRYFDSLSAADHGDIRAFVDFCHWAMLETTEILQQAYRIAQRPTTLTIERIRTLYNTAGGFTHLEVDRAGQRLLDLFHEEFTQHISNAVATPELALAASIRGVVGSEPSDAKYRRVLSQAERMLRIEGSTQDPAQASILIDLAMRVPRDCERYDKVQLVAHRSNIVVAQATVPELRSASNEALRFRLRLSAEVFASELLEKLLSKAAAKLRSNGYTPPKG